MLNSKIRVFRIIIMLIVVLVVPFLPLLLSWRWGWWEAWVFALTGVLGFIVSRLLAARRHPDLIIERSRFGTHENTKSWDRILAPMVSMGGASIPLVAGLDERFGWSPSFTLTMKIIALILFLAGFVLGSYALVENRFFSGMVRIQAERGHRVVTEGPYRWIRHPGYSGALLSYLATPLLLDSSWALVPAGILMILLLVRTALEDKSLQEELDGYRDYSMKVRYRLLPWVW